MILDPAPTATASCPAAPGNNQNSDKAQPYGFLLGSPGQNARAIDMTQGGTLVGNGVFLLIQAPGSTAQSNAIDLKAGAQFFINGRSDIFNYTGPGCITAPVNQNLSCSLAKASQWGTAGSAAGTYQGDPISIMVTYMQGASPFSPNGGSRVIAFNSGSTSDVQGMLDSPQRDNCRGRAWERRRQGRRVHANLLEQERQDHRGVRDHRANRFWPIQLSDSIFCNSKKTPSAASANPARRSAPSRTLSPTRLPSRMPSCTTRKV